MSKAWAEQHGVTTPADYNRAREETYASRHANGTGPFMVEAFEPRGDYVLVRNPDWWGTADYPHNIDRIVHTHKEGDAEKRRRPARGRDRSAPGPAVLGARPDPPHPRPEAGAQDGAAARRSSVSIRAAPSCARPTSRGAIRSRTSGCARRWPMRSTSRRSCSDLMGELLHPGRDAGRPGRQRLCGGTGPAAPLRPREGQGAARRGRLPGRLQRDPRLSERVGRRRDRHLQRRGCSSSAPSVSRSPSTCCRRMRSMRSSTRIARATSSSTSGTWIRIPRGCLREWFPVRDIWNVSGYANPRVDELIDEDQDRDGDLRARRLSRGSLEDRHSTTSSTCRSATGRLVACARTWTSRPTPGTCRAFASRGSRRPRSTEQGIRTRSTMAPNVPGHAARG